MLHYFFQLANLVLISLFILNHSIFWIAGSQWAATVRINERAQFWGTKYIFRWSGYHHLGLRCSQTSVITIRIQRIVSEIIILNRFFCSSRWVIYRGCDHQVWKRGSLPLKIFVINIIKNYLWFLTLRIFKSFQLLLIMLIIELEVRRAIPFLLCVSTASKRRSIWWFYWLEGFILKRT